MRHHGTQLEVIGEGNLLHAVTSVLATNHIIAVDTIPDMFRTTANVTGSLALAAVLRKQT